MQTGRLACSAGGGPQRLRVGHPHCQHGSPAQFHSHLGLLPVAARHNTFHSLIRWPPQVSERGKLFTVLSMSPR